MQTVEDAKIALETYFADWVRALDIQIDDIGAGTARLSIPITDKIARVGGIVSGQALMTLADTSMVFACAGHFGEFRPVAITDLHTQFLRPGSGDRIACHAEIVRAGKSLVFTRAVLLAQPSGKEVATATATFFVP